MTSIDTNFNNSTGVYTTTLQVGKRQIKGSWTAEAAEDMKVLHGVDLEKELVEAMGRKIMGKKFGIYKEVHGRKYFDFN